MRYAPRTLILNSTRRQSNAWSVIAFDLLTDPKTFKLNTILPWLRYGLHCILTNSTSNLQPLKACWERRKEIWRTNKIMTENQRRSVDFIQSRIMQFYIALITDFDIATITFITFWFLYLPKSSLKCIGWVRKFAMHFHRFETAKINFCYAFCLKSPWVLRSKIHVYLVLVNCKQIINIREA